MNAIVLGGYGTFGAHVARELAAEGVPVTIAGRDAGKAQRLARTLGRAHRELVVDVRDGAAWRAALGGHAVAVNCAGPLTELGPALLDSCLDAGCAYVDLAVERGSAVIVRERGDEFRRRGLAAVYGCSSLPGISGALALALVRQDKPGDSPASGEVYPRRPGASARSGPPFEAARVTLLIGNDNPKGSAAVRSLLEVLGRPVEAPQGVLRGFAGREVVELPPPFGRRPVFTFDSPEYDLFPALLGVRSVEVKVGFELPLASYGFALLAWSGLRLGRRTAALIGRAGEVLRGVGSSGGAVLVELFGAAGVCRASLGARQHGQRMAALPCALAARELCRGTCSATGSLTVYELLGADRLLRELASRGFDWRLDKEA